MPAMAILCFDDLPTDLQMNILCLLPISTLVLCKIVSTSWRSLIQSTDFANFFPLHNSRTRDDPIFLLYSGCHSDLSASAYLPSTDRWMNFRFPLPIPNDPITGTSLVLGLQRNRYYISDPFAPAQQKRYLPSVIDSDRSHRALALIDDSGSDFRVLVVSTFTPLLSQIYTSATGQWKPYLQPDRHFFFLGSAVYLENSFFCLTKRPDHLLQLDPVSRFWDVLDIEMPRPLMHCRHLMGFQSQVYLVAHFEEHLEASRIGIWKLDREGPWWIELCFMPDEFFTEFSVGALRGLVVLDRLGYICFSTTKPKKLVMYDLVEKRWWCPDSDPCGDRRTSVGLALQTHNLLLR